MQYGFRCVFNPGAIVERSEVKVVFPKVLISVKTYPKNRRIIFIEQVMVTLRFL